MSEIKPCCGVPDIEQAMALIKAHGIRAFIGHDGCICGFTDICGIRIDVHCHRSGCDKCKGRAGIHVSSRHCASPKDSELLALAKEVEKQVNAFDSGPRQYRLLTVARDE